MSDEPEPTTLEKAIANGWMKAWHPKGIQVTLPVFGDGTPFDYASALASVTACLDSGWLVQCPGLEEGEQKETVGWVCHGTGEGMHGSYDYVLLYLDNEQTHFSFLKVYLDKPEDVAKFEFASGLKLDNLPIYVGDNKPERGKSKQVDRFIVRVPKPFQVILKANPKYNPDEKDTKKKKPARLFVRWADEKPAQPSGDEPDAKLVQAWIDKLDADPPLDELNSMLPGLKAIEHKPTRTRIWSEISQRAAMAGLVFDADAKAFKVES